MKWNIVLSFLTSTIFTIACHKNHQPSGQSQIREIYTHVSDFQDSSRHVYFSYDGNGKVSHLKTTGFGPETDFIYNSFGQLDRAISIYDQWPYPTVDSFFYASNGVLSRVSISGKKYDPNFNVISFYELHFLTNDVMGRITKDSVVASDFPIPLGYDFSYNQNGDIVGWNDLGSSEPINQICYTNINNPLKSISIIYYFVYGDFVWLSNHAPRDFAPHAWFYNSGLSHPVNYSYQFDGDGRIGTIKIQNVPTIPITTYIDIYYR